MNNTNSSHYDCDDHNLPPDQRKPCHVCKVCQKNFAAWDCYANSMVCGFTVEKTICSNCYNKSKKQ